MKHPKTLIITLIIIIACLSLITRYEYNKYMDSKKVTFMAQYVPIETSEHILKWSKYYRLNWVEVFNTVATESEFKVKAKSRKGNKGLMQISKHLAEIGQMRFKGIIKNRNSYNPEFNIATGCMHLNAIRSYLQKDPEKCWVQTYAIYNAGRRGFYIKKYRIGGAINRFIDNLSFYEVQWNNY